MRYSRAGVPSVLFLSRCIPREVAITIRAMAEVVYDSARQRELRRVPRELVRARELLLDLVWKDLRVRYRYAAMGFLWAIAEPLVLTLVLSFVFTFVLADKAAFAQQGSERPFPVMLLCGLIFWQFLATSLTAATNSLVDNQNLVKKVHLTREIIPIAACGYPLLNLFIGFVLLLIVHVVFGGGLHFALLWCLPIFAIELCLVLGFGLLLACGNAYFRDVGYIVGVLVLFGFYASPVFYPLELVQGAEEVPRWAYLLYLVNPMAALLTAYREILFDHRLPELTLLAWPLLAALLALALGTAVFRRHAPSISDQL